MYEWFLKTAVKGIFKDGNNGVRLTFGGNSQWYFWPNLLTIVMAPPGAW
jgi:hypothetical protein